METLSRIRPVYAIAAGVVLLVGLAVFGATRGDGTESVVAGADSSQVVASVADRELTVGELDDLLPHAERVESEMSALSRTLVGRDAQPRGTVVITMPHAHQNAHELFHFLRTILG